MKNLSLCFILLGLGLGFAGVQPVGGQPAEWSLKVSRDGAAVRVKPDAASAVAATLPKGTELKSAAKQGDWFRVVVPAGQEGALIIGYISAADVEVGKKAAAAPDAWALAPEEYRGARISVRFSGGFLYFGSGDVSDGALGEFDRMVSVIDSSGATIKSRQRTAVHTGYDLTADFIYHLNGRIGLGVRFDYIHSYPESSVLFGYGSSTKEYTLDTTPLIDAYGLRPGAYFELPLNRWLRFQINGGPGIYFVNYEFARRFVYPGTEGGLLEDDAHYKVTASRIAFQAGVGLDFQLNKRASFYVEVQGRYARMSNLEGTEWGYYWANNQVVNTTTDGFLYYGEKGGYPDLSVLEEQTAAARSYRRGVLDLSGVSAAAGIRIRF